MKAVLWMKRRTVVKCVADQGGSTLLLAAFAREANGLSGLRPIAIGTKSRAVVLLISLLLLWTMRHEMFVLRSLDPREVEMGHNVIILGKKGAPTLLQ